MKQTYDIPREDALFITFFFCTNAGGAKAAAEEASRLMKNSGSDEKDINEKAVAFATAAFGAFLNKYGQTLQGAGNMTEKAQMVPMEA